MGKGMLVLKIVKEYLYRGLTEEELKQAGLDGLKIAEEKYNKRADFHPPCELNFCDVLESLSLHP